MVSVIIVNFNGETLIERCLDALYRQSYRDFEIIVVDNGSSDNSLKAITTFVRTASMKLPVRIVALGRNLGFAGGNSEGLAAASGEYIALLNNDTEPDKRWLEELVRGLEVDEGIGICASKMLCYESTLIDSAGDGLSRMLKGFKIGEGTSSVRRNCRGYVFGACAGAALYRRKMLELIGFLDEDFFLIHEDTDINVRAQLAGWRVLYVPTAVVRHKVRSSIGTMSDAAIYYSLRNSELVRMKSIPFAILARCSLTLVLGSISEFLYFAVRHRRLGLFAKAKIDAIKMIPRMLEKRKKIMRTRRVSNRYLLTIMTPVWQKAHFRAKLNRFLYG